MGLQAERLTGTASKRMFQLAQGKFLDAVRTHPSSSYTFYKWGLFLYNMSNHPSFRFYSVILNSIFRTQKMGTELLQMAQEKLQRSLDLRGSFSKNLHLAEVYLLISC